jgi:hypothetical protein
MEPQTSLAQQQRIALRPNQILDFRAGLADVSLKAERKMVE